MMIGSTCQPASPQPTTVATAQPAPAVSEPAKESVAPVVETPATAETVAEAPAPATATATADSGDTGKKSADDILNMIRNRQSS